MDDSPLSLHGEPRSPEELDSLDHEDLSRLLLRAMDNFSTMQEQSTQRMLRRRSFSPNQIPDRFLTTGTATGTLRTPEEIRTAERTPVSALHLPRECTSLLARTGATTRAILLSQLCHPDLSDQDLPKWHLRSLLSSESRNALIPKDDLEQENQDHDSWYLAGPFGIWRERLLEDALNAMNAADAALLRDMSERERSEVLNLLSISMACPDTHQEIFPSRTTWTVALMHYRYRCGEAHICSSLNLSQAEFRMHLEDLLLGVGPACTLFLLTLRRDEDQTRRILDQEPRPWFCSLLETLFPDTCTPDFFRTWSPPGGLQVQEQVIAGCVRAAAAEIPGAGDGELLLRPLQNQEPLPALCETLDIPIWEAKRIRSALQASLSQDPFRTILLEGFSIGSLALRQTLERSTRNTAWVARLPFTLLRLPWHAQTVLDQIFHRTDLRSLTCLIWPEETLAGAIREKLADGLPAIRAWLLSSGARPMLEAHRTLLQAGNAVPGFRSYLCRVLDDESSAQAVSLLEQTPEDTLAQILPQMRDFIWGIAPTLFALPTPLQTRRAELAIYYEAVPFQTLAILLNPEQWQYIASDLMYRNSTARGLAEALPDLLSSLPPSADADTPGGPPEQEDEAPEPEKRKLSQAEKKAQNRGNRSRKKKLKKGRKKK